MNRNMHHPVLVTLLTFGLGSLLVTTACSSDPEQVPSETSMADAGTDTSDARNMTDAIDDGSAADGADSTGELADLVVSNVDVEPIGERESGRFDFYLNASLGNEGNATATDVACSAKIVPKEMKDQIETIRRDFDLGFTNFAAGESRDLQMEFHLIADEDDEDYNARFEVKCTASNESGDTSEDNRGVFTSTVLYY